MPEQPNGLGNIFGTDTQLDPFSLEGQLQGLGSASDLPANFDDNTYNGGDTIDGLDPSRRTLAFELASAEPTAHNSDLLAELGLDQDATAASDVSFQDHQEPSELSYDAGHGVNGRATDAALQTPLRKTKSRASYASLRQSPDARSLHKPSLSFSTATGAHNEDEEAAERFLSLSYANDLANLDQTMQAVSTFIVNLEGNNDTSADQQLSLERGATSYVKDVYRAAKSKEDAVRELKEVQKALENPDPTWQAILADLEPILPHEYGLPSESLLPIRKTRLATLIEEEGEPIRAVPSSAGNTTKLHDNRLQAQLADLRMLTDSLVASLGAVSEQTQIAKAANHDISRRLKSLDSGVSRIRSETEALERSLAHIAAYEAEEARYLQQNALFKQTALPGLAEPRRRKISSNSSKSVSSNGSVGASGRYSQQVKGGMKSASKLLESAHERARILLASSA